MPCNRASIPHKSKKRNRLVSRGATILVIQNERSEVKNLRPETSILRSDSRRIATLNMSCVQRTDYRQLSSVVAAANAMLSQTKRR